MCQLWQADVHHTCVLGIKGNQLGLELSLKVNNIIIVHVLKPHIASYKKLEND